MLFLEGLLDGYNSALKTGDGVVLNKMTMLELLFINNNNEIMELSNGLVEMNNNNSTRRFRFKENEINQNEDNTLLFNKTLNPELKLKLKQLKNKNEHKNN